MKKEEDGCIGGTFFSIARVRAPACRFNFIKEPNPPASGSSVTMTSLRSHSATAKCRENNLTIIIAFSSLSPVFYCLLLSYRPAAPHA